MNRFVRVAVMAWLIASVTGCCASPYRRWQNYVGWNNPRPEYFAKGPPAPRYTPPGPTTPAVLPPPPSVRSN